jgi:hypothetical protein
MAVTLTPVFRGTIPGDKTGDLPYDAFGLLNDNDAALKTAVDLVLDNPQNTILGRITASTGNPEQLTAAQVRTIINVEDGATADQTAGEIEAIVSHDNLQGVSAAEHIDWSITGAEDIHADRIAASAVTQHQASLSIGWSQITGEPTTLSGYGITDAVPDSHLGGNIHLDWTADQGATDIHPNNYTNTTYTAGDFNHDDLANVSVNEHIDWTITGAEQIHADRLPASGWADMSEAVWTGGTQSEIADGASAIAFEFATDNAFSTSGAKLFSLKNTTTEAFYIDKDGAPHLPRTIPYSVDHLGTIIPLVGVDSSNRKILGALTSNSTTKIIFGNSSNIGAIQFLNNNYNIDFNNGPLQTANMSLTGDGEWLSAESDGATAVGHVFDTAAFSTAGAQIAAFRNNNVDKATIDKDGNIAGNNLSGTNTGDQTSIVGITGTATEFNTALTGADFAFVGGAFHNGFSDYDADEHIDWTVDDAQLIHIDNIQTFGTSQAGKVPQSGGGTTNYLRADGTWAAPGGGDNDLDSTPGTDHSVSGLTTTLNTGTTGFTIGQVAYIDSTGDAVPADADASTTMPVVAMATGTISGSSSGSFLLKGFVRDDTWAWNPGGLIYASTTAGGLTQTAPSGTGDQVQIVGWAISADVMFFDPQLVTAEVP